MNDINLLMSRVEEINAKDPPLPAEDIDALIAYHRLMRQRRASGEKPKRSAPDLGELLKMTQPKEEPPSWATKKRRIW